MSKKEKPWRKIERAARWRPEIGEVLIGKYTKSETLEGPFGRYVRFVICEESGRRWSLSGRSIEESFTGLMTGIEVQVICTTVEEFDAADGTLRERREYDVYFR